MKMSRCTALFKKKNPAKYKCNGNQISSAVTVAYKQMLFTKRTIYEVYLFSASLPYFDMYFFQIF